MALPKPPYCTFSRVHVPEKQKGHAVRATVHDKASRRPGRMQDVRRLTISSLSCLSLSIFHLSSSHPSSFPSSCLSCFAEAAFYGSTFCLFHFSLHPLSAFTSKLRTARCSETLQLLAGGLASYTVLALCVLRGNRRQFAPICVWHHFLEIFIVVLNRSLVLARLPVPQLASGLLPKPTTNSSNLFWIVSYIHLPLS